jgi:hypothetical protein
MMPSRRCEAPERSLMEDWWLKPDPDLKGCYYRRSSRVDEVIE